MSLEFTCAENREYFKRIIGKIFKILPLCEDHVETVSEYIDSLTRELQGCLQTIPSVYKRAELMSVINSLLFLKKDTNDLSVVKSVVFNCIRIVSDIGGVQK